MTPFITYFSIISHAKKRDLKSNYVIHYVFPLNFGAKANELNTVKLTDRENYFINYLLCKIFPENTKIQSSFVQHFKRALDKSVLTEDTIELNSSRMYAKYKSLISLSSEEAKCLTYMRRFLANADIKYPNDADFIRGWNLSVAESSQSWRNYFDENDWISLCHLYFSIKPIDTTIKFSRKDSKTGLKNQNRSRLLATFIRCIESKTCWHKIEPDSDGKWTIDDYFIKVARYYYDRGQTWKMINWRKYFDDENDWLDSVKSELSKYKFNFVKYDFN